MANINEQDKNFKKVRFYQDKILLETELNELQDIQNRRFEDEVYDSLGNVIISGFSVQKSTGWNVSVDMGKSYIKGKVVNSKGSNDTLSIVSPNNYLGDLTLYVILKPIDKVYLPEEEGDKGWEPGVGEPTTYRTEESYEVVIAQVGQAIIIGGQVYAQELPTDSTSYIELARILRPETAISIDDCTIRDTRTNLISKLSEIVNKKFYMKAEQEYLDFSEMLSPNVLLITPGSNGKDERDRICTDLNVCPVELTTLSSEDSLSWVYDIDGNKINVDSIVTQDILNETLDEATVTLSGDVAEKVYIPIVGESNLLLSENPDFENGTSDPAQWIPNNNPLFDVSGSKSQNGNFAVGVSNNNSYTSENLIEVVGGNKYIITASLMADNVSALNYQFSIEWYNDVSTLISTEIKEVVITTDHKKYIALITAPALAISAKIKLNGDGNNSSNWFWVDNVEFFDDISTSNLLTDNPDFTVGSTHPDDWTATGYPVYSTDEIKVSHENLYRSNQFISVLESNEYVVGAIIKADGVEKKCRILVEWYDEYYDLIGSSYENIIVTDTYDHYYLRVVSPASIVKYAKIVLDGDGINSANEFWYDNIEFYDYDESATNLIASNNNSFETGYYVVDKWDVTGSPIYSTSGFDSYVGKDILKVSHDNSYTSNSFIAVTAELPYMLSAYIRANDISALTYQFRVDWYDSLQDFISSSTIDDISVIKDNFSYKKGIFTAPTGASYLKIVLDGDGVNSNNWFWVDKISILPVTEHVQFPIVLHYGYEYTLANLPANFAMADIISGVSIDMAIQEILGNRYFDGSLQIASDGTNSVDRRLVDLWDELHNHRHKGLISPRLEARDIDLINTPGTTTQKTTEDHVNTVGTGKPDNNNPHGLSAKNIDIKEDEVPYPNEYSDDTLLAKTSIHGEVNVSMADHILEIGTGIPDSDNPHGLDSSDIEHNSETNPDNSFKTIEQALFDRVKDFQGDGVIRGLRIFPEDSNYIKITDGYAYINGKRIRVGNSIIIKEVLIGSDTNKIFRITGALVNDLVYVTYFNKFGYYRWIATTYQEEGMLKIDINDSNMDYNYTSIDIISYNNLKWDNNENFEIQLSTTYRQLSVIALSGIHDRIDIVVMNSNGVISLIKGVEDLIRRKPILPNNSIKIGEIYVNYNGVGTDPITYDDVSDNRFRIDWKHGSGSGRGYNDSSTQGTEITDISVWKRLQSLDTTIDYYKQLFVNAFDMGSSLSRIAVETFIDNSNIDEDNSEYIRLDDANIYLGIDEVPLQSEDLVADWRTFGPNGGVGTWVSKTYIGEYTIGVNNLLSINNHDFEIGAADPSNWDKIGSPIYSTDATKSFKGSDAIKVSNGNSYTTSNFIEVNSTKSYKIVAYIKAEQINIDCRFKATWYNIIHGSIGESTAIVHTSNSRYDKYEAVLVAPMDAKYVKITLDGDGVDSNNWFWYDNLEFIELDNIESILFYVRETLNGGNNQIRYYLSNDGSLPTEQVLPNALHIFNSVGSELRVKIEIEPNNNDGNMQPRVHSFALVWGIGQGHNHNGENSDNILGDDKDNDILTVIGGLKLIGKNYDIEDVSTMLAYLQPPQPPLIGNYNEGTEELPINSVINGPIDMRIDLSEFNFVSNAFIPADAILLPGTDIVVGQEHDGVTRLFSPINVYCYIYPADRGYIEVTVNGNLLGYINLTALWADNSFTDRSQAKLNPVSRMRTLTEQTDYLETNFGVIGDNIELTERMSYVPPQIDKPFPYYQTAKCKFIFDPSIWLNSLGVAGEEELGKIKITHYNDSGKLTIISSDESPSIFNDNV